MPFTLRGTKQSAFAIFYKVLQRISNFAALFGLQLTAGFVCHVLLTMGTSPTTDNALYSVEVSPIMKLFFNLSMILETFTEQASTRHKIKVRRTEEGMLMHRMVGNFDTRKDSKHQTQIDVIHCKWLKARDVLCSCHLQIMDLSYDVGRWQYGKCGGGATGSLDACLCKGQPYYVDIERAQWPKQACQPRQASKQVSVRVTVSGGRVSGDLGYRSATQRGNSTPFKTSHHFLNKDVRLETWRQGKVCTVLTTESSSECL